MIIKRKHSPGYTGLPVKDYKWEPVCVVLPNQNRAHVQLSEVSRQIEGIVTLLVRKSRKAAGIFHIPPGNFSTPLLGIVIKESPLSERGRSQLSLDLSLTYPRTSRGSCATRASRGPEKRGEGGRAPPRRGRMHGALAVLVQREGARPRLEAAAPNCSQKMTKVLSHN